MEVCSPHRSAVIGLTLTGYFGLGGGTRAMIVSRLEQLREIDEAALQHSDNFIFRRLPPA
jgi:hypothetical protein